MPILQIFGWIYILSDSADTSFALTPRNVGADLTGGGGSGEGSIPAVYPAPPPLVGVDDISPNPPPAHTHARPPVICIALRLRKGKAF
jgi:hypothetical protein